MSGVICWERPTQAAAGRKATPGSPDDLLTLRELAAATGLGYPVVQRLAYERQISVYKLGKWVFVSRREFAEFLAAAREPARA